jgi:hypothetical protein
MPEVQVVSDYGWQEMYVSETAQIVAINRAIGAASSN